MVPEPTRFHSMIALGRSSHMWMENNVFNQALRRGEKQATYADLTSDMP
jgi:hypothetical protein